MSSSSNSVAVVIEADSQGASKQSSLLLSPDLRPNKLGITKTIPGKTSVVPKYQGNDGHLIQKLHDILTMVHN
jgi:hypothetical protein